MKKKMMVTKVSPMVKSLSRTIRLDGVMVQNRPATILYKKLPDNMILITGFENFLSLDEIFDKYGRVVATAYNGYPYHMASSLGAIFLTGMPQFPVVANGMPSLSKDGFSKIVAHVKKCGGLLHDIIQACDKGEVKRIKI